MIPKFPNFKNIELKDLAEVEKITQQFPPYNDFEFTSLWTYDTLGKNTLSILNSNLVIKIQDFISGDLFYSFIGITNVSDTVEQLLLRCENEGLDQKLYLVPEMCIKENVLPNNFLITEDVNNSDYILSVDELASLSGKKYYDKRNLVNRFCKTYPNHIVQPLDLKESKTRNEIIQLFKIWTQQKEKNDNDTKIELTAITKLFDLSDLIQIFGIGVYVNEKLIGFTTYHLVQDGYAIMSFEKGDITFDGIYAYLNHMSAKHLQTLGYKYINYEQDLGIPGLKKAKQLWRPVFFLKKFTISRK